MAAGNDIEYECLNCGNVTRRPSYWGLPLTCKCPEPRFKTLSQVTFEKKLREMAAALIGHLGLGASPERINLATSRLQSAYALGQQEERDRCLEIVEQICQDKYDRRNIASAIRREKAAKDYDGAKNGSRE
jgi:hypothetical protein